MASSSWNERLKTMKIDDTPLAEFDQYAPSYSLLLQDLLRSRFAQDPLHFHRRKWLVIQSTLKRAGLDPSKRRWLDVGCGQGELLKIAGGNFAEAIGCDPSAGMIAPSNPFRVEHQPSATELPFENASFDFVTAVCVFHHVHGSARTLLTREIRRVLKPRGLCCVMEHNPWNPVTRAIVRRCPVDVDAELLTARQAAAMLRGADFETVGTEYFLYFPERIFNRMSPAERFLRNIPFGGQYALLSTTPA